MDLAVQLPKISDGNANSLSPNNLQESTTLPSLEDLPSAHSDIEIPQSLSKRSSPTTASASIGLKRSPSGEEDGEDDHGDAKKLRLDSDRPLPPSESNPDIPDDTTSETAAIQVLDEKSKYSCIRKGH